MQTPELVPRPIVNDLVPVGGSPEMIADRAEALMREIQAGSVDADSFAANAILALSAMGIEIPPAYSVMLAGMLAGAWQQ